jgi:NADP-dependent 3-hydroxy acid dehydrogenase YdfG
MYFRKLLARQPTELEVELFMSNRTILVTGATSGIGRAVTADLCNQEHNVVATGRSAKRLSEIERDYGPKASRLVTLKTDLTETNDIAQKAHDVLTDDMPQISGFILCAGVGLPGSLLTSDNSEWSALVETNVVSLMQQARSCANYLCADADNGPPKIRRDIVIIGSTVGREISAKNPVYGATKAAVHSMTEALRREVCGRSIRVSLIEPGFVRSEFQENSGYDMNWVSDLDDQIGPLLRPSDIAHVVSFVIGQPAGVHIDDVRLRPTRQPL